MNIVSQEIGRPGHVSSDAHRALRGLLSAVVLVMLVGTAEFAHAAPPAALNTAGDFIFAPLEAIGSPNAATDASEAIFPTNANRSDLSVTTPESEPLVVEAEIDFFGGMPTPPADRILRMQSLAMLNDPAALFRAALTATEQEDFSHADWLYAQIVGKHPVVGGFASRPAAARSRSRRRGTTDRNGNFGCFQRIAPARATA